MSRSNSKDIEEKNSRRALSEENEEKNIFPEYCMIAPSQQDVLDHRDETTVCSNRS